MNDEGCPTGHGLREIARLRAGIVNAIEAFQDGDYDYVVKILLALDDAPTNRFGCPRCPLTFEWPGLRDHHLLISHPEERCAIAA